nr:hypothetical protein CPGR_05056 [Mycolicibacterium malmesburyense]
MSVQKTSKSGLAAVIGMLGAMALIGLAPSAQADDACFDVDVVFARGTNEPAGLGPENQAAEFAAARVSGAPVPPATQLTSDVSSGG